MSKLAENISRTFFLPDRCIERLLPLQGVAAAPLRARGVLLSGMSDIRPPYDIRRPDPPFHSLNVTIAGKGVFESDHGTAAFTTGDTWIVPAHTPCTYQVPEGGHWQIVWFHLHDIDRWASIRGNAPNNVDCYWSTLLASAMNGYVSECLQRQPGSATVALHFAEIIATYLDRILLSQSSPEFFRVQNQLARLWEAVNNELNHPWTVAELCDLLHVSPSKLQRLVQEYYDASPMEMVTRLRMDRAEELLRFTDCTLNDIAEQLGYQTPFALSKAFKRTKGCSPRSYRKNSAS